MTDAFDAGVLRFAGDLAGNIAQGDAYCQALLDEADAWVERNGYDLPEEPAAREIAPDPDCITDPIRELSLAEAGINTVLWATGFRVDYSWLEFDVTDASGRPKHLRGISPEPGIYFLGLPWQSRRGSAFIWGVWHDAKFIADHIATQHTYLDYRAPGER
jgi:putative flavoprotein involved in K+ transport